MQTITRWIGKEIQAIEFRFSAVGLRKIKPLRLPTRLKLGFERLWADKPTSLFRLTSSHTSFQASIQTKIPSSHQGRRKPPRYHPACQANCLTARSALTGVSRRRLAIFASPVEPVLQIQDNRRVRPKHPRNGWYSAGTLPGLHLALPTRWQMVYYSCFRFFGEKVLRDQPIRTQLLA